MPLFILKINNNFQYEAFHCGVKCIIKTLSQNRITILNRWLHIVEAVRFLNTYEIKSKKNIIEQQLFSMGDKLVTDKKYSVKTMIRAFEYFAMLPHATYNRLREDFQLPTITTLTRLTSKVKSVHEDIYLQKVFSNLFDFRHKNCILLLDEVYVKTMLQYHGGTVFGKADNNPNVLAKTVLSFMVVTLFGGPKFLWKMLPVCEIDSNFLFEQTNFLLSAIKAAGGNVVCIVWDGNRVNQAFFKKFETDGVPWRTKDNIYLLYDFVHLLKNICNNWIIKKTQELEFYVVNEKKLPNGLIVALHKLESNQMIKMSKLTDIAVFPN